MTLVQAIKNAAFLLARKGCETNVQVYRYKEGRKGWTVQKGYYLQHMAYNFTSGPNSKRTKKEWEAIIRRFFINIEEEDTKYFKKS